jgi:hypothetical protein
MVQYISLAQKIEVTMACVSCIVVVIPEAERGHSKERPDILERKSTSSCHELTEGFN